MKQQAVRRQFIAALDALVAQIKEDSASPTPARISAASQQCVTELVAAAQSHAATSPGEAAPGATETGAAEAPAEAEGAADNAAH